MGTHPIFESDFDCLTEWVAEVEECSVVEVDPPHPLHAQQRHHRHHLLPQLLHLVGLDSWDRWPPLLEVLLLGRLLVADFHRLFLVEVALARLPLLLPPLPLLRLLLLEVPTLNKKPSRSHARVKWASLFSALSILPMWLTVLDI